MPNSAYNFVPLSDKVFFPDWSDKVSMDIPFRDGVSGDITIELTSHSPIFTRNSDTPEDTSFFRIMPNGAFGIPGTSIKGVIRNVLEIATFCKIQVSNARYSVRDLHNQPLYGTHMSSPNILGDIRAYAPKVNAGWLTRRNNKIVILPCEFARINQSTIIEHFRGIANLQNLRTDGTKGFEKRDLLLNNHIELEQNFYIDSKTCAYPHSCGHLAYKMAHFNDGLGKVKQQGTLVFSGQCGRKHMEFVFYNTNENKAITVTPEQYDDFVFIHSESGQPNKEWGYWKKVFNKDGNVPIFYLQENGLLKFGLAMMFKLAYNNSIHDAISHTGKDSPHLSHRKDFAETLFGCADDQDSLRGRVNFSAMTAVGNPRPQGQITTILNSPKPTFYPYYVKQKSVNNWSTFMDNDCEIAGWKRYPIKSRTNVQAPNDNAAVATRFTPLVAGTTFKGKLYLHNVRKCEVGAILWALDFGKREECRHSVGMAKPYGLGSASIRIVGSNLTTNSDYGYHNDNEPLLEECRQAFISEMNKFLKGCWEETYQLQNLIRYAMVHDDERVLQQLCYPNLGPRNNEFIDIKRNPNNHLNSEVTEATCQERCQRARRAYEETLAQEALAAQMALEANMSEAEKNINQAREIFNKNYLNKENSNYKVNDNIFGDKVYAPIILNMVKKNSENGLQPVTVKEFTDMKAEDSFVVAIEELNTIPTNEFIKFLEELKQFIKDKKDKKFKNISKILTQIVNK